MPEFSSPYSVLEFILNNVLRKLLRCVGLNHWLQVPQGLTRIRRHAEFYHCVTLAWAPEPSTASFFLSEAVSLISYHTWSSRADEIGLVKQLAALWPSARPQQMSG